MKILISGATGLVGTALVRTLLLDEEPHEVTVLSRSPSHCSFSPELPIKVIKGDLNTEIPEDPALQSIEAVIHLAGENVASGRWSEKRKEGILKSRKIGTQNLIEGLKRSHSHPKVFVSASAVGIYGDRLDEVLTEDSSLGEGFLTEVCKAWEKETLRAEELGARVVSIRIGVVLSQNGGALKKMLSPFKMGVGGILGGGKQFMSWIHIEDLVRLLIHTLKTDSMTGAYNGVSPHPVTNREFTRVLASVLKKPALFSVPSLALKLLFGEMSSILLESQRVHPKRALEVGFKFHYSDLRSALCNLEC